MLSGRHPSTALAGTNQYSHTQQILLYGSQTPGNQTSTCRSSVCHAPWWTPSTHMHEKKRFQSIPAHLLYTPAPGGTVPRQYPAGSHAKLPDNVHKHALSLKQVASPAAAHIQTAQPIPAWLQTQHTQYTPRCDPLTQYINKHNRPG